MSIVLKPPDLSRRTVVTYLVEAGLLAISFYGFWHWAHIQTQGPNVSDNRWSFAYLVLLGIAPLVLFNLIAIRAAASAASIASTSGFQSRINQLQKRLNTQDDFFQALNDDMPSSLVIYTNNDEYWFLNSSAARRIGHRENDILGKKPSAVLGAARGRRVERDLLFVRQTGRPFETLDQEIDENSKIRYIKTNYCTFAASGDFQGGIIARGEDVTTIVAERERRETMLRQIISTLVAVVDRRDPYASGHSSRVGQLSRALASEMQLSDEEIDAAEIAGSLMNFGKVLVSRSILTKVEALTPDELQRVRDGILTSADILSLIEFGTPVVPTLRQSLERFDGTGVPNGLSSDDILMTAGIIAVANAFVALVSPRAYRPGMDVAEAIMRLGHDAGKAFNPRIISALENYMNKSSGKLDWLISSN